MISKLKKHLLQNNSFKQTVAKNSFRLLVSEFLARLFTFLISLRIAHNRWKSEFWIYNYVMTFSTFFILIIDFWLWNLTFRELSKKPENSGKYLTNIIFIKSILSIIVLFIVRIITKLSHDANIYSGLIIIFLLHSIITNFLEFFRIFFRSQERMEHEAALKIWNNLILFISTIGFLLISQSVQYIFYGYLASSIINLIISLWYMKCHFHFQKERLDFTYMKNILKMSIPFFLWGIFTYFYWDIIIILLKKFTWESEVWLFSAPYKLLSYVYIIFNVFSLAMFTKLVSATKISMDRFQHIIKKFALYHIWLSSIFCIGFILFAKYILGILYWSDFTDSDTIDVMKILSIILIFKSISYVFGNALTAMSKEYTRLYIQVIIAILNISCALLFIPLYWIKWAACALIISEFFIMIWYRLFTKHHINKLKKQEKNQQ